jgi:3-dehydroquinate synthase
MKTLDIGTIEVELGARRYPVHVGHGLLGDAAHWRGLAEGRRCLLVTNETVAPLYLARVEQGLAGLTQAVLVLPDGERHKTLDSAARIFEALAALGADRDSIVIALGGGVIGDLAGFAAATWMRGIRLLQMPTTLLAMVDSSVGGKTGVNLASGKNLVGAFHQPLAVIADTATLASLPDRERRAGLAEVVKYGAIGDAAFFAWLELHAAALDAQEAPAVAQAIVTACRHKAAIVARDEREQGERALLNFGHSFGHALETATGYQRWLHGEAVAIGMVLAARLSAQLGRAPPGDGERLSALLQAFGLPVALPRELDADALLGPMRLDKKSRDGRLHLVLWRGIGRAEVVADVPEDAIRALVTAR